MQNKKAIQVTLRILIVLYALLFVTLILAAIFPGGDPPPPLYIPWYGWVILGIVLATAITTLTAMIIVSRQKREQREKTQSRSD